MRSHLKFGLLAALTAAALPLFNSHADTFRRHQDHVLGTSFDLVVTASSAEAADAAEDAILAEIDRLNDVFSLYKPSELRRLNDADRLIVSDDLVTVWTVCESYREQTGNALSCRIGDLTAAWQDAEATQTVPSRPDLRLRAGETRRAEIGLDTSINQITRPNAVRFDMNALAKGYILDAALTAGRKAAPEADGVLVNIGGDIRAWGEGPHDGAWSVAVTDASELADGASAPAGALRIRSGAIAASGQGPRDREIAGQAFGHVISPADGWPVAHVRAASVYAPTAIEADALATALMVMELKSGLSYIASQPGIEAEVVTADGRRHATSGWSALQIRPEEQGSEGAGWPEGKRLDVALTIPEQDTADYERPYVAVWIADPRRNLVRILMLAGDESRWMEENYFWYRRFALKAGSLVDAVAGPTRRPGRYDLQWDGLTDDGQTVPPGGYILHVEAAREHGGHQRSSHAFTLSEAPFSATIPAGEELGEIEIRFGGAK
ncbi:DUF2271 domain-containing protein [Hyphomonas sp.]|uniref:DUF2271 domain-containing protein n=1 Tax=Hyphomonas sp. TaxID=87 RepID=UPI0025C18DA4|nr:DUF2271 domain-containing protein [Hyphomonas sp.]